MVEPDVIESRSRPAAPRPWLWVIAVASLVALGFVVVHNGAAHRVAVQPSVTAAANQPSLAGTTSGPPRAATVPGVSRAAVERNVRALGVSPTHPGYETGQVTDSATGTELHITVYGPDGGDGITGFQCIFVKDGVKVDARLVARAAQCLLPAVPAKDQAAVSSWLTANGTGVSVAVPRAYDIDGLRLTVGRIAKAFSVMVAVPPPAAG